MIYLGLVGLVLCGQAFKNLENCHLNFVGEAEAIVDKELGSWIWGWEDAILVWVAGSKSSGAEIKVNGPKLGAK